MDSSSSIENRISREREPAPPGESQADTAPARASQPRYRFNPWATEDTLPALIFQCERDEDKEIVWVMVEGPLARRLDISTRHVKGTPIYQRMPPELGKNWYHNIDAVFRGKGGEWVSEHEGRYYNHHPQPLVDTDGTVTAVVGHSIDATELVAAQRTIDDLVEQRREFAQAIDRTKQEMETMNYTLSHDLRNPLTVILAQCELAQRDVKENNTQGTLGHLEKLREATNRMNEMLGDILKLSRVGRAPLDRKHLDLAPLAKQIFEQFKSTQPDREVEFKVSPRLWVEGDRTLLRDLFENLLSNAWKYTSEQPEPWIAVEGEKRGNEVWICIRDNGIGFKPEEAQKLFVPFTRLPAVSEYKGTGVGLATAKRIVERHGGKIEAKGEPGKGAEFCFTLPRASPEGAEASRPAAPSS